MKKSGKKSKVSKQRNRRITRRHQVSLDISDQVRGKVADVMTLVAATAGVVTLALLLHVGPLYALPKGGDVVPGSASIAQTRAATTTITQNSTRAVINWQAYGIGAKESVRYTQPGQSPTPIYKEPGNGQVWVSNPNGILVGRDPVMKIPSDQQNITAGLGKDHTASGEKMTVTFAGNNLISLMVDKEALGMENNGAITDGGQVLLTPKVAGEMLKNVINNSGLIEARSISEKNGIITLQ